MSSQVVKYQWVKGEKFGNVEEIDRSEEGFIYFKSGTRINADLLLEFLLPVDKVAGAMNKNDMMGNTSRVSTVNFKQEESNYSPPVIDPNQNFSENIEQQPEQIQQRPVQPQPETNPIIILINKSAKDDLDIKFQYQVKFPKQSVYTLIKDGFEVDIDKVLLDNIISQIDINTLRKELEAQILNTIKTHYTKTK